MKDIFKGNPGSILALLSMLFEEFWENLSGEERSHFEMPYDSDLLSKEDDDFADRLCSW